MRLLLSPYFVVPLVLYSLVKVSRLNFPYLLPSWINDYLSDLLCLPIVLILILAIIRTIKKERLILPLSAVVLVTAQIAVYFEWYLPQNYKGYTSDPIDVLMYAAGALIFIVFQRSKLRST